MSEDYYKLLGIKPGQMDTNGVVYSKEALDKAVKEFVTNFKNGNKMGELALKGLPSLIYAGIRNSRMKLEKEC